MKYTHAQISPIFRTTKLATAWSRTYPHGHTLPQLLTNPENHQPTAQLSPPPSGGLHGAFKTSPAPYPATLQHSTISSFHSCWDCASSEEHCLVLPGCTRGRESHKHPKGWEPPEGGQVPGPQRNPGPDRERRCSQELSARLPRLDLVLSRGSCSAMLPPAGSQVTGQAAAVMRPPGVIHRT